MYHGDVLYSNKVLIPENSCVISYVVFLLFNPLNVETLEHVNVTWALKPKNKEI